VIVAGGYTGKILRVNLTEEKFKIEPLPEEWIKPYIGGDGFGAKLLFEELPAGIDPLSEQNKLIICHWTNNRNNVANEWKNCSYLKGSIDWNLG